MGQDPKRISKSGKGTMEHINHRSKYKIALENMANIQTIKNSKHNKRCKIWLKLSFPKFNKLKHIKLLQAPTEHLIVDLLKMKRRTLREGDETFHCKPPIHYKGHTLRIHPQVNEVNLNKEMTTPSHMDHISSHNK